MCREDDAREVRGLAELILPSQRDAEEGTGGFVLAESALLGLASKRGSGGRFGDFACGSVGWGEAPAGLYVRDRPNEVYPRCALGSTAPHEGVEVLVS